MAPHDEASELADGDPTTRLFELALGLARPWQIGKIEFDPEGRRLDLHLGFPRGSRFACSECAREDCPVHDRVSKEWRHLNFFQHEAYLHAQVPRVRCEEHGVRQVRVPWAREGSGFTVLFEALAMVLMREMPVRAAAKILGEHDTRLWRLLLHYVEAARSREDHAQVRWVGVDETSHRRGHSYVSLFADLERSKVLFATPGRESATVERFKADLEAHGGKTEQIREFSLDMSPAFCAGIETNFPRAEMTLDRYHVVQLQNQALETLRREEQRSHPELKKTRYLWLKRPSRLTSRQRERLAEYRQRHSNLARAYELKLEFDELWEQPTELAEPYLADWCQRVWESGSKLEPLKSFADTIVANWDRLLHWFDTHISNGIMEAINGLVQAAKRRARGYRSDRHYIAMIYMTAAKLDFALPT
jgi:transposase